MALSAKHRAAISAGLKAYWKGGGKRLSATKKRGPVQQGPLYGAGKSNTRAGKKAKRHGPVQQGKYPTVRP